ncbi:M10 family metallopeptidase C-terminal domain-containing protein [Microvirga arsenatis]|uniref:Peptidase M10 serralysin C-terminal domain-containing protein n=1 Tax=Microvirga arsenatis TaxID=2692265 RepID=A0ABW9YYH2_9HYPH|nr:M10 family metallopeptidase C-terminal domain-containing protein [Microvirga arsenatis]NBJ11179.1 hypothetical protein [Microvirga arsenatis]NBJ25452.1 hypothetical protein [Microvirga arsenatis]
MPAKFISALRLPVSSRFAWNSSDGEPARVSYRFMPSAEGSNVGFGDPASGFRPFTKPEQSDVKRIFDSISSRVNIEFYQVGTNAVADINFGMFQIPGREGYASGTPYLRDGVYAIRMDVFLHRSYNSGQQAILALHHEIGHALGLKHPFEGTPRLSLSEMPISIMSYDYDIRSTQFSFFEIASLQSIYGPAKRKLGNDTHIFGSQRLLWDGGGNDTINAEQVRDKVSINLKDGSWNWIGQKRASILDLGQVYLGDHSTFENVRGSRFGDALTGNAENNIIRGNGGHDSIRGLSGNDTLYGGAGNDTLQGGAGGDYMQGGSGRDRFVFSRASDLGSFERHDRIVKFNPSEGDRLDFSKFDADPNTGGRQKLDFRVGQDFAVSGKAQVVFDRSTHSLVFDVNGDGVADTNLTLPGIGLVKHSYLIL